MIFKNKSIFSSMDRSGGPFVHWSGTICHQILVEGIMYSCKIVLNVAILFGRAEPIDTVLAEGIIRNISVKFHVIRASGSGDVV